MVECLLQPCEGGCNAFLEMDEKPIDFGELSQDESFKQRILSLQEDVGSASALVKKVIEEYNYDELTLEDKVRYDLFLSFAINSYFWMYLRLKGIDPNQHEIKGQINRVKDYMKKSRDIYEKKTIMPRLDQGAAKRFVRSGLWTPQTSKKSHSISEPEESQNPSKRQKKDAND